METFSVSLAHCAGNSPVTGEFPSQRPVTHSFDVFFDLRLNKRLSKQSRRRWLETPSCSLWRHCNVWLTFCRHLQMHSINWKYWIGIQMSWKFVPKDPMDKKSALFQEMAPKKPLANSFSLSPRASIHQADEGITARSREVSKPWYSGLDFSSRSEIWLAHRQRCCRDACQISERYYHYNMQSRDFDTSRDLVVRRLATKLSE